MMTKFNVGDEIVLTQEFCEHEKGKMGVIDRVDTRDDEFTYHLRKGGWVNDGCIALVRKKESASDRRLTEAEAKIKTLEAEVKALKTAQKSKLGYSCEELAAAAAIVAKAGTGLSKQTPNQRRADVIKRAQAFVADTLTAVGKTHAKKSEANYVSNQWLSRVDFVVNAEKHTVVAIVRVKHGDKILTKAVAKCAPGDVFNADIGKAIVLERAYGVKVPKDFYNAPQPESVVVGMVVEAKYGSRYETDPYKVVSIDGDELHDVPGEGFITADQAVIIDDTDAVYV